MSLPELSFNITPLKLNNELTRFDNTKNLSTPISPNNLFSTNSVSASPLVTLHQELSQSNEAYPDTSRARAQENVDSEVSDSDQSASVIITDVDDDDDDESLSSKEPEASTEELRRLKKQLESAHKKSNEKEAERIQRQINALTRKSGDKSKDPSENENIDGAESTPLKNKKIAAYFRQKN